MANAGAAAAPATFEIGKKDFLLNGKPFQMRCGELHYARIPREYWRNRLQLCKAMGLNTVCAYLFWNFHEWEKGKIDWSGQRDVAEFCRITQEEGLWVLLRPGPYSCAEWEMGGLPWWLLKNKDIALRSRDPDFLAASRAWLKEVGKVLGPLQVTKGGPILMVQAENEYGFYGTDVEYMGEIRDAILAAGFDVPIFACNPVGALKKGFRDDIFQVVNFGKDPAGGFAALRNLQPSGPLMCGEFYPGWFDMWGLPHAERSAERYLKDLKYMLEHNGSFSIYMAHGGTSFGMWAGANIPFASVTSSYDYDAPISEAGWVGEKFDESRKLMARHLLSGEKLPDPPPPNPVMALPPFELAESALLKANLPAPIRDETPQTMEMYDQGRGCILYRTTLPPGPAATLSVGALHDFGWVSLDDKPIGVIDRRFQQDSIALPERTASAVLDILVEAMGRVNFGPGIHDRKGIHPPVLLVEKGKSRELENWEIFPLKFGDAMPAGMKWQKAKAQGPAFWRGNFHVEKPADTFLDLRKWGKGLVWVNDHCLGRFWNIGPTQTMYLPGPWLKKGENKIVVLDLLGPEQPVIAGLEKPILDQLRPELDFNQLAKAYGKIKLMPGSRIHRGSFAPGPDVQEIKFEKPVEGRQFCIEALNAHDGGNAAAVAEIDLFDADGQPIAHDKWRIAYVDSEETKNENGAALNAISGQTADSWRTAAAGKSRYPYRLVIDLGKKMKISGFRYTPQQGDEKVPGRIKDYRIYIANRLVR